MSVPNEEIILAAMATVGPPPTREVTFPDGRVFPITDDPAWRTQVAAAAVKIKSMLDDNAITSALSQIDPASGAEFKVFTGVIVTVVPEQSSNRAVITINTGTQQAVEGLPAGHEQVRTERLERPGSKEIARQAQGLVGRYVRLGVQLEPWTDNPQRKTRVLRVLTDLGEPRNAA